jgi:hypothetical protein
VPSATTRPPSPVEVLRGEQHRGAGRDERAHRVPDLGAAARIQPGGRLVEEEHRGRQDHAHGEVEPPAHAAGVLADRPGAGVGEVEAIQQLVGAPAGGPRRQVEQPAEHHQVAAAVEDLVDRGVLADQPDPPPYVRGLRGHVEAVDRGSPAVGAQQGGEDADGSGLARPVRAEQPVHRARWHGQVEPVERGLAGSRVALAERLGAHGGNHVPPGTQV